MLDVFARIRQVADVSLSADGMVLAYSVREVDADENRYVDTIWWTELERPSPRCLGPGSRPRWSPSGRTLAFVRSGARGARVMVMHDPSAQPVEVGPEGRFVSAPHWAPDAERVALVGIPAEAEPTQTQLFVLDVASGQLEQVTHAEQGSFAPAWSADATRVAFSRRAANGRPGDCDVWIADLAAGTERQLTRGLRCATSPSWSPDDRQLVCLGDGDPASGEDHCCSVFAIDVQTGDWRRIATDDTAVVLAKQHTATAAPLWRGPDTILTRVSHHGDIQLASFSLSGELQRVDVRDRQVIAFDARGGRLALSCSEPTDPAVVCWLDRDGVEHSLPSLNPELQEAMRSLEVVRRSFPDGTDERTIDGWIIRPRGAVQPRRLAIALHGGPHAYSSASFASAHLYRYELAEQGWCVLILNHTGSGSYGRGFAEAIHGHWGAVDLREVLSAADALVASGEADPARWAIVGYSYGGFLSAWAIANTDRFSAAVVGAPVANLESFARTSDIGPWYVPNQTGSTDPAVWRACSPVNVAQRVRTPTLLLHGEADARCPIGQSEELFEVLVATAAPVELIRYPHGDHDLPGSGIPAHRLDYHRRIVDWLQQHVRAP